ncbi:MAG: YkvA family protein [Gemmatimonadota bacterium]|nr:YkvA family protein [Gemmatimonadota bacterium]
MNETTDPKDQPQPESRASAHNTRDSDVDARLNERSDSDRDAPRRSSNPDRRDARDADRPRTGAKRNVMGAIAQIPAYLRLLAGLVTDKRVSKLDKFFVLAAAVYIVSPIDLIPDFIPFFGEVDDVFLLMIALQRLVNNAGRSVLLSHWSGHPDDVHHLSFARIVSAAGFFLPSQLKRRLFRMAGGSRKKRSR